MEILTRSFLIAALICGLTAPAHSQTWEEQVQAFQNSYLSEASGDYPDAIMVLQSIYDENSYELNLRLGYLCYLAGRYTESVSYYNAAIRLMPYAIEPRLGFAMPAAAMGNYTQVLAQYEKILEISPNNSLVLHRMGLIYYGRKEYTHAEKHFEKVVNLYPFDYDALTMLAWTKLYLNKTREAKALFRKAVLNTPNGATATEGLEKLGMGEEWGSGDSLNP